MNSLSSSVLHQQNNLENNSAQIKVIDQDVFEVSNNDYAVNSTKFGSLYDEK